MRFRGSIGAHGPVLQGCIVCAECTKRQGPPLHVIARGPVLIDTGASTNAVDLDVLAQCLAHMKLVVGRSDMHGIGESSVEAVAYLDALLGIYPDNKPADAPIIMCPFDYETRQPITRHYLYAIKMAKGPAVADGMPIAILGRSFLEKVHFTYDGPANQFELHYQGRTITSSAL
mgnify:CR=1 FL=1